MDFRQTHTQGTDSFTTMDAHFLIAGGLPLPPSQITPLPTQPAKPEVRVAERLLYNLGRTQYLAQTDTWIEHWTSSASPKAILSRLVKNRTMKKMRRSQVLPLSSANVTGACLGVSWDNKRQPYVSIANAETRSS
jgi:hypothetical protein